MNVHVHRWTAPALTEFAVAAGLTPYPTGLPEDRLVFVNTENS
jgi:hypothetical protein